MKNVLKGIQFYIHIIESMGQDQKL